MSYLFEIEGKSVWWPALAVGTSYMGALRGLEAAYRVDSGVTDVGGDMVAIDPKKFAAFIQRLVDRVESLTAAAPLHDLMFAVVPPAVVMLERVGRSVRLDERVWTNKLEEVRSEMPA